MYLPSMLVQFKKGDKVFALTPGYYNETPEGEAFKVCRYDN